MFCLYVILFTMYAGYLVSQKKALDFLERELQTIESYHVGAENWT